MMQTQSTNLQQLLSTVHARQTELVKWAGCSAATVSLAVKHGQFPKRGADTLRQQFTSFFVSRGIAPTKVAEALDVKKAEEKAATLSPAQQPSTNSQQEMDNPMLLQNETLTPAARKHFGLFRNPFTDDINSRDDVFLSPDIRLCRELLWDVAKNGGFCAIVGESGSGKTTLGEELDERIHREGAPVIVIRPYILAMEDNDVKGKTLKASQIAETIISTLDPNASPKRTPHARFKQLHDLLKASYKSGNTHVLVIEEAHSLPIATLKHLKRFRELKDGFARLLGVVLIGQPELKIKLSAHNPEVREVVQRCEVVELEPLDRHLQDYITHKIKRVGGNAADIFEADAFDAIRAKLTRTARGGKASEAISICYPLVVNNLVTKVMNVAAAIAAEKISADLVKEAA
jgi:type II secretory pathway predicted ATPase ExeA